MVKLRCQDDLPSRVLDLLKTVLAASSRGETAVLVLETKKKAVNTKYRSVDIEVGSQAPLTNTSRRKWNNPARAKRSQLRLEAYRAKKLEEQARLEHQQTLDNNAAGISSSNPNKLVLKLAKQKEKILVTPSATPTIPQVDGVAEDERSRFAFESSYHVDDVMETLKEILIQME